MKHNYSTLLLKEDFPLEIGGFISDPVIAYQTFGTLNQQKDNVIFVCHALTANSDVSDWWSGLFGEGDIIDPTKYFIICANNLGSPYGTSSSKKINPETNERFGLDFPFYTIRDTAKLHIKLLEEFGITQIKLLIGGSCGGNICQEIAYDWGECIENLVLMCCSSKETPWAIAIHESQRTVLNSDPTLSQKDETAGQAGLKACRAVALPFYRTHESFKIRQKEDDLNKVKDFKAASYIDYQGEKFVKRFDAHCYHSLLTALDTHNIGRGRKSVENALSKIKAKTLVIGFDSDILIPKIEQKILAEYIPNAAYAEINTIFGHDAFLIENEAIRSVIKSIIDI